jgi:hypothetical protein
MIAMTTVILYKYVCHDISVLGSNTDKIIMLLTHFHDAATMYHET